MLRRTFLELAAGATAVGLAYPGRAFAALPEADRAAADHRWLIVSPDGPYTTVQAAVDAVPAGNTEQITIAVRPGTYRGQVIIPSTKPFLRLVGTGRRPGDVVIADDRANGTLKPDGTTWGTSGSASVTIDAADFAAVNLTFANLFDEKGHPEIANKQAVAVLTRGDRLIFDRVRFLGNQDTLYVNSSAATVIARSYLHDCYVEGDVDFIFGRGTAVFDRCRIHSLDRDSTPAGYVTAPSTDINNPHGLLFTHCNFTSDAPAGSVYLGRPWHPSQDPNAIGETIVRDSVIGAHIGATAWSDFGTWPWQDARFAEYHNRGPGAVVSPDRPQLTPAEAREETPAAFLRGADGWHPEI
jgi:pectinesterase